MEENLPTHQPMVRVIPIVKALPNLTRILFTHVGRIGMMHAELERDRPEHSAINTLPSPTTACNSIFMRRRQGGADTSMRWLMLIGIIVLLVLALTRTLPWPARIASVILGVFLLVLSFRRQPGH